MLVKVNIIKQHLRKNRKNMLNTILKKHIIILLSILFFGAFQQAVAQDNTTEEPNVEEVLQDDSATETVIEQKPLVPEKRVRGRGGRGWGLGVSYITTGLNEPAPTVMYRSKRHISYRFITSQFDYSDTASETEGDSSYDIDLNFALGSDTLITNIHPFGGRFYFALGIADFELVVGFGGTATGKATETQDVMAKGVDTGVDVNVDFEVSANMGGSLGYEGFATYTGLGWGTKHPDKRGFGMRFELGVIQMPKPKADLYVNNFRISAQADVPGAQPVTTDGSAFQDEVNELNRDTEEYEREAEKEAAQLNQFPVIELGISYHF